MDYRLLSYSEQDNDRCGFTVLELIVVIALMAVLVGILSPMFIKYVEKAKQSTDITNAEAAYSAAMVYYSASEGYVPARLYFDGNDVKESEDGIAGYGKSKTPFGDFLPDDFPITNVDGIPNDVVPNYIIITMGSEGVEGLGWGVAVAAVHPDGTPKYNNRVFTPDEWTQARDENSLVERDIELFNSLEAVASEMTYGELIKMAADQGLDRSNFAGNFCIKIAKSYIYKSDHRVGETDRNAIFAKELFRRAGYNTNLPEDQMYIVSSRQGGETDVWIDFGHTYDEIVNNPDLYNAKASDVIVYGYGYDSTEKFDDGALDHEARAADKAVRKAAKTE